MSQRLQPLTSIISSSSSTSTGSNSIITTPLSGPSPPFLVYLTGSRVLIWDLPAAHVLRLQHRIVGECRAAVIQPPRKSGAEQLAADDEDHAATAAYTRAPVHYALHQAHWLLQHGLISLLDGTVVAALRQMRFHHTESNSGDARLISVEERRLYLIRYMQQANQQKQTKRAQHNKQPPQLLPSTTLHADDQTLSSAAPPAAAQPAVSAYPPFSTHAVAEALLSEPSISPAVPLSSLPVTILSHCSSPVPLLPSLSDSPASLRLRSMCAESSTARLTRAFADLHHRGYVVTAGQQYGGDLMLYANDPSNCHSHSTVSLVHSSDQTTGGDANISALDLLTAARIGSTVSKGVVLAYEAAGSGELSYLSVHWQSSLSAVP